MSGFSQHSAECKDAKGPGLLAEIDPHIRRDWPADQERTQQRWLLLVYHVPAEPSRLRATVWRRIKHLGAIYLRNSVAALPASAPAELAMRKLHSQIIGMPGSAVLLSCKVLAGESDIRAALQSAEKSEHDELL
jgi:DNA-binding transcriptional regulator PaaX